MENSDGLTLADKLSREPAWLKRPAVENFLKHLPVFLLVVFLFLLYGYFLAHKIDLTTADFGRHIRNGELLLEDSGVLTSNFYSYTHPDFPVVNHHWGSGALFYFAAKLGGFVGVQLFFILISLAALAVFLLSARRFAGWGIVGFAALLVIPLLAERTEIRPEVFSYLFAGLFFWFLSVSRDWNDKVRSERLLWILPLIQILWVNTHIYFLLGPLLIGAFLLDALIQNRAALARLSGIFVATVGATFINPFGYRALTGALTLFENFGYRLAENQSVWFLERLGMTNPNFLIFKVMLGVLGLSFILMLYRNWRGTRLAHVFIAAGISTLAFLATRNFALFGFFLVPLLAANIRTAFGGHVPERPLRTAALALTSATLLIFVLFTVPRYFPYWRSFGFGLEQGNNAAVEFLQTNNIQGPLFNNYDIGGYLIFHLFPREKVFVDNRPEAYPASFFQETYIPMQEREERWQEEFSRYQFNAIVFSYHDATPWGQQFLTSRVRDPAWAPVFADSKVIVFVRRSPENDALIGRYEIPRDAFQVSYSP